MLTAAARPTSATWRASAIWSLFTAGCSERGPHRMMHIRGLHKGSVRLAEGASSCGRVGIYATRCQNSCSSPAGEDKEPLILLLLSKLGYMTCDASARAPPCEGRGVTSWNVR